MKVAPPNKRPGVDAGGAVCLHIGGQWPSATQAERSLKGSLNALITKLRGEGGLSPRA